MLPGILPLSALRAVSSPMTRPDLPSIHSRPDHPHSVVVGWYAILPLLRRPDRKPWFAGCCSTRLQRPKRVYWFHPQTQTRGRLPMFCIAEAIAPDGYRPTRRITAATRARSAWAMAVPEGRHRPSRNKGHSAAMPLRPPRRPRPRSLRKPLGRGKAGARWGQFRAPCLTFCERSI